MEIENKLDKFGKFIVDNLRDKGISFAELLLIGHWKATSLQNLHNELGKLSDSQKEAVKKAVISAMDSAIHDFLFALQEQEEIQIMTDGENVVELSDGIHGEQFSEEGWFAKFSKYGETD